MELPSFFQDFLSEIRPTSDQNERMKNANQDLQQRLQSDKELSPILVTTFIQGSYRRHTALKAESNEHCDVDVVAVTRLDKKVVSPQKALDTFKPFLDRNYRGRYEIQGRSWGIQWDDVVKLDLVPTSAPSEAMIHIFETKNLGTWTPEIGPWLREDVKRNANLVADPLFEAIQLARKSDSKWALEPLDIPDREAKIWDRTHPLAQIEWTTQKNQTTNGHYINMVKALKWWRRKKEPIPKYPKSYPLEHMLGMNCADGIQSIAHAVVATLEAAVNVYQVEVRKPKTPFLPDHGFAPHLAPDVFGRLSCDDFIAFYSKLEKAAETARKALECQSMYESSKLWRALFGNEFPLADPQSEKKGSSSQGFSPPKEARKVIPTRFAIL